MVKEHEKGGAESQLPLSFLRGDFAPIVFSVKGSLITFNPTLPLLGDGKGWGYYCSGLEIQLLLLL